MNDRTAITEAVDAIFDTVDGRGPGGARARPPPGPGRSGQAEAGDHCSAGDLPGSGLPITARGT
jgi:hypothetical protein